MNIVIDAHHIVSVLYQLKYRWVSQSACLRPGPASFNDSHAAVSSLRPTPAPSPLSSYPAPAHSHEPVLPSSLRGGVPSTATAAAVVGELNCCYSITINGILHVKFMGLFLFTGNRLLPHFASIM